MADLFKSAFGYLGANGSTTSSDTSNFVGQEVDVSGIRLKVKKVLAEGGFAFVYIAQDLSNGRTYALKRLLGTDQAACDSIRQEVAISKQLSGHPYVVDFISAATIDKTKSQENRHEFLLLSELCTGGSLVDALRLLDGKLMPVDQVCAIVYQTAKAVQHMQSQTPPITHRDLKIENLLISEGGVIKLCDFGSAMTKSYEVDLGWSANQRGLLEDEMAQHTTPMYRAPEMLDTWSNYPINFQADIWALGCILYYLCYLKHPFEDSAKLRIVNGNFAIPANDGKYECFHDLIRGMLKVDPNQRLRIADVLERLCAIAETKGFALKAPLKIPYKKIDLSTTPGMTKPTTPDVSKTSQGMSIFMPWFGCCCALKYDKLTLVSESFES